MSITIDFPKLTEADYRACGTEAEKCVELFWPYTLWDGKPGPGVDLACGGISAIPWAVCFDLPIAAYAHYNSRHAPRGPLHVRGYVDQPLIFEDDSFAWCLASHIVEDFLMEDWPRLFREWSRIVRPGGHLIVLAPDKERWGYAIRELGQIPNCSHKFEPKAGDMALVAESIGLEVVMDKLTELYPHDYGLIGVFRKPTGISSAYPQ